MRINRDRRIMHRRRGNAFLAISAIVVVAAIALIIISTTYDGTVSKPYASLLSTATGKQTDKPGTALPNTHTDLRTIEPSPSNAGAQEQPVGPGRAFTGVIAAQSAVVFDEDGNVLFESNAGNRQYPASTTKVLTALIVLEHGSLDEVVRVGDEANMPKPGSSIAGLRYGEKLSVSDLLNALLIPSGNDAAYVLAAYTGRKAKNSPNMDAQEAVAAFVELMNEKVRELGASHSHFTSPDGYHDEEQYTTAMDMALIAREALKHKEFRTIVSTETYRLPDVQAKDKDGNVKKIRRVLKNTNLLLDPSSPFYLKGCIGIKTGHTSDAGYCLVSAAEQGGESVVAVVMGSTENAVWTDSSSLLKWGLGDE